MNIWVEIILFINIHSNLNVQVSTESEKERMADMAKFKIALAETAVYGNINLIYVNFDSFTSFVIFIVGFGMEWIEGSYLWLPVPLQTRFHWRAIKAISISCINMCVKVQFSSMSVEIAFQKPCTGMEIGYMQTSNSNLMQAVGCPL